MGGSLRLKSYVYMFCMVIAVFEMSSRSVQVIHTVIELSAFDFFSINTQIARYSLGQVTGVAYFSTHFCGLPHVGQRILLAKMTGSFRAGAMTFYILYLS